MHFFYSIPLHQSWCKNFVTRDFTWMYAYIMICAENKDFFFNFMLY